MSGATLSHSPSCKHTHWQSELRYQLPVTFPWLALPCFALPCLSWPYPTWPCLPCPSPSLGLSLYIEFGCIVGWRSPSLQPGAGSPAAVHCINPTSAETWAQCGTTITMAYAQNLSGTQSATHLQPDECGGSLYSQLDPLTPARLALNLPRKLTRMESDRAISTPEAWASTKLTNWC